VNIVEIISELKNERNRIEEAIAALNGSSSNGATSSPFHQQPSTRTRRRSQMSAEGRRRISPNDEKRWAGAARRLPPRSRVFLPDNSPASACSPCRGRDG